MENTKVAFETLIEKAEEFGNTAIELSKLKAVNASAIVVSSLITRLVIIITIAVFLIILSIGLSIYLGNKMGEMYLGFMIVSLFYLILTIIFHYKLYQWIKKPISELIIKETLG